MISFLRGTIAAKFIDAAVIEVGGVGYRVSMSGKSLSRLGHVGEEVKVLTRLQVRDDALVLYGFLSQEEERLFAKLTSVSSVGPKVALSALSTYEPENLVSAIVSQDIGAIQQIPGVGKKMASRIALELKESFADDAQVALPGISAKAASARKGAMEALLSMGFTSEETDLALKGAPEEANETILLQYALKRLGK